MLFCALDELNGGVVGGRGSSVGEGVFMDWEVEEPGSGAQIVHGDEHTEHYVVLLVCFENEFRGFRLVFYLRGCADHFPFYCFKAHVGEEDNENCENSSRNNASSGRGVFCLAVVPYQLARGEKINASESFTGRWNAGHAFNLINLNLMEMDDDLNSETI